MGPRWGKPSREAAERIQLEAFYGRTTVTLSEVLLALTAIREAVGAPEDIRLFVRTSACSPTGSPTPSRTPDHPCARAHRPAAVLRGTRTPAVSITLYPAVDIKDGRAVRLTQGAAAAESVYDDDSVAAARRFTDGGSSWLHVVDLDAAFTGEPRNRGLIAAIIDATGAKVQASGGVRTLEDVRTCVGFGAERVVIGTRALTEPDFVRSVFDELGPVCAVGLDVRGDALQARGWTEEAGDLWEAVETFTAMGVPRFVVTDVDKDGMLQGPNTDLLRRVAERTDAAITASGGVSTLDDLRAINDLHDRVDAAIVGKPLYAGAFTIEDALAVCAGEA